MELSTLLLLAGMLGNGLAVPTDASVNSPAAHSLQERQSCSGTPPPPPESLDESGSTDVEPQGTNTIYDGVCLPSTSHGRAYCAFCYHGYWTYHTCSDTIMCPGNLSYCNYSDSTGLAVCSGPST